MFNISKKVRQRLIQGIKKFQGILNDAKKKDLNESDTVRIVAGIFVDLLGYDRYSEISSELNIKGTFCDLCIKLKNKIQLLIEVKAVGLDLKASYLKQAVDYAANQGIDWIILTNGYIWEVYKVFFSKPLNQELVFRLDFSIIHHKDESNINELYVLSKEGMLKGSLDSYFNQKKALSKYYIGAILLTDSILNRIKRQVKNISPEVKVTEEQIKEVLETDVLKREILESEKYKEALKAVSKARRKREKANKDDSDEQVEEKVESNTVEVESNS